MWFLTKRERRQRAIDKWYALWSKKPVELAPFLNRESGTFWESLGEDADDRRIKQVKHDLTWFAQQMSDKEYRDKVIKCWLDKAEADASFASSLDKELGLRTNAEDDEYATHWSTMRNQGWLLYALIAIGISLVSLFVSLYALDRSTEQVAAPQEENTNEQIQENDETPKPP